MKRSRLMATLALVLALSACGGVDVQQQTGGEPTVPASPLPTAPATTTSATPTPKTEPVDDREAAVTVAVNRYYQVLDGLYRKPNSSPDRQLARVSRGEALNFWQNEVLNMYVAEQHVSGSIKRQPVEIHSIEKKDGRLQASAAVCWDVSGTDVVDKKGKSVIDRKQRPNQGSDALTLTTYGDKWYVVRDRDGDEKC